LDETSKPSTQLDLLDKLTSCHVLVAGALLLSAALSLVLALVI